MRGLVICAGGLRLLANAYVTLRRVRELSQLPVELCYAGSEEMPAAFATRLVQEIPGLRLRDLGSQRRGWHIKPFALAGSSFEEVLLLDADNLPLGPFESLFEHAEYRRTGALFWPDLPEARWTQDSLYAELGLDPALNRATCEFESGQLVLDRPRCRAALETACRLSDEGQREQIYARLYGDKDVFRLAFRLAGLEYAVVEPGPVRFGAPFFILRIPGSDSVIKLDHSRGSFYATGLLQHHPDGSPLFAHKTVMEWKAYLDFVGMTQVEQDGIVTCAPALAELERWGYARLAEFRQRYRGMFPPDRREIIYSWLRGLALGVLTYWPRRSSQE